MEKYDYRENLKQDIKDYIKENKEYLEGKSEEELYDLFFLEDAITGNASGSYYCNAYKAEEALNHNWDLVQEACEMFGDGSVDFSKGAEYFDVTVRCYLLGEVLHDVLEEIDWEC